MANALYVRGLYKLADYSWDLDTVDIGVMLVASTYTFDKAHNTLNDVSSDEAAGAGYARKLVVAAKRTTNEDDAGSAANLRITDGSVVWTSINAGVNLRVVLFFVTGDNVNDNDNELLGYIDTGTNVPITTNGGDVGLNFGSAGVIKLQ
jgi:hypothetical protein